MPLALVYSQFPLLVSLLPYLESEQSFTKQCLSDIQNAPVGSYLYHYKNQRPYNGLQGATELSRPAWLTGLNHRTRAAPQTPQHTSARTVAMTAEFCPEHASPRICVAYAFVSFKSKLKCHLLRETFLNTPSST